MRGGTLDGSTDTENLVSMHQENNVGVAVARMHQRHANSDSKNAFVATRQGTSPCYGKSRVRSVTEESPNAQNGQFTLLMH